MGLRCLLSHDFGEPELEREREEQGNEVVITVNEVKTCSRCGERQLVSENTEVTSMEQLTDSATGYADREADPQTPKSQQPAGTERPESTAESSSGGVSDIGVTIDTSDSTTDDAEVLTDDTNDTDDEPADLGGTTTANMTVDDVEAAAAEPAEPIDAADDDGVILSDDPETDATETTAEVADSETTAGREPGEWPEYDDRDDSEAVDRPWPDTDEDDEGFSADEPSDETPEDMTFGGGFTPEITDSDVVADTDDEMELSFTRAEEASVDYEPTVDDIETEFYCPECGLSRLAGNSSMRSGDICPDCRRGYIDERPT